ncbi:LacI family DNA-binding transcriptional regulator [Marinococcus sp. PL1-022]|uniref:LacI family DNA-binding transcriptional regulator n=1 Tax=Marinococcus sp. PL1-022 TaxID=3095363 RepID=UPI0039B50663
MNALNKKRVTLKQVAEHAGVSRATASLIVRNSPSISKPTREKVLQSMEELGYVYDRVAANLREQRSTTIGLIITDISNPFYSELLVGVHETLEKEGYTILLGTTFDSEEKQRKLLSTMMENRVGGVILCPVSDTSMTDIESLNKWQLPLVLAVREIDGLVSDYVGVNYERGAYLATKHLLEEGHTSIAFVGGGSESLAWKDRENGYMKAYKEWGKELDTSLIEAGTTDRNGGVQAIKSIFNKDKKPTAVFCFNDTVAFGVLEELRNQGKIPGEDVAVVGFDDVPEAEALSYPALTTVSSYPKEIGARAAALLKEQLGNDERDRKRIILEPELVVRKSTFPLTK